MTNELDRDWRDCPKCGVRMENKGLISTHDRYKYSELYQCPECKNVEILTSDDS